MCIVYGTNNADSLVTEIFIGNSVLRLVRIVGVV